MSGPHIEDEWFSMTDDEIVRFMCGLRPESVDPATARLPPRAADHAGVG